VIEILGGHQDFFCNGLPSQMGRPVFRLAITWQGHQHSAAMSF